MAAPEASFLPFAELGPGQDRPDEKTGAGVRVRVLLPLPLAGPYDYAVPVGVTLQPGDFVRVPLGKRELEGVVWDAQTQAAGAKMGSLTSRLRPVVARLDVPPLPLPHRRFIDWVATYTMAAPGAVLRLTLPASLDLTPPRPRLGYRRASDAGKTKLKLTPARQRVLAALGDEPQSAHSLAEAAACGLTVVRALADAGVLEAVLMEAAPAFAPPDSTQAVPQFSPSQSVAVDALRERVMAARYAAVVLDGVTGSGKTEVYLEAIAACLAEGRQALVLLPEIGLSAQGLARFGARFGVAPALWHSDLGPLERRTTWRAVATGQARVVVGARSALFLPFQNLGLIVVDEEHDSGFKQEDGVIYHARDMAVARAHITGIPIVLASATPSLETVVNVSMGRYSRLELPNRHAGATLPEITLLDLRQDRPPRQRWLASGLVTDITAALAAGEQAMLFLNRRGYAPLTVCRGCGHKLECPNCSAWLVEHRSTKRLCCHHCDYTIPMPDRCPHCGEAGLLAPSGPGVERISEEAAIAFPGARTAIMASDTLSGGPKAMQDLVARVQAHEVDLLIGTQVMAKGHHFPLLTVVGVVDADIGLGGGDLRAGERTYQMLHQVAGRAGRAERPGRVVLQTTMPEHPLMQALKAWDRDAFLTRESEERQIHAMPPYGRLVALIVSGEDGTAVDAVARALGQMAPRAKDITVLGPAPAPLALLRSRHRRRLLLKAPRSFPVQPLVRAWLAAVKIPASVRVQIDVDPYSFM